MSPLRQPESKVLDRAPTFTVRMRGVTVGWSSLEHLDDGMGVAHGAFRPADGYDLVEPIFRLYAEAVGDPPREPADEAKLARYFAARDRLGLTLHAPNGSVVPTGWIDIHDFRPEGGDDAIEIMAQLLDQDAWWSAVGGRREGKPGAESP